MNFSKKNHEHHKANRSFVSKTNYLTFLFLISLCFGFAQTTDSLSVEELQRREKNIQAGNPFKKFGYKPKIATLSKGKYLEFHDLDSIVKIGSFTYHVKNKSITGYVQIEEKNSEATLSPEIVSRWFSPDPLSEEFPSWNPYHFVHNNPINMIDPTGLSAVWIPKVYEDGSISYIAEAGDNVESLVNQFGLDQKAAEAIIVGTTGSTQIAEGTEVSGETVNNVTGSDILKLNISNSSVTDADIVNQTIFSIRNEVINDQLWIKGGNPDLADYSVNVNDYFSGVKKFASGSAGGTFYGFGTDLRNLTSINVNGVSLDVGVDFSAANDGRFSNFSGKERTLFNGRTAIEFLHPNAYPKDPTQGGRGGIRSINNPVMTMYTKNPNVLLNYLQNGN